MSACKRLPAGHAARFNVTQKHCTTPLITGDQEKGRARKLAEQRGGGATAGLGTGHAREQTGAAAGAAMGEAGAKRPLPRKRPRGIYCRAGGAMKAGAPRLDGPALIKQLGGIRPAARLLSVPVSTVAGWKRNGIPSYRWSQIEATLRAAADFNDLTSGRRHER